MGGVSGVVDFPLGAGGGFMAGWLKGSAMAADAANGLGRECESDGAAGIAGLDIRGKGLWVDGAGGDYFDLFSPVAGNARLMRVVVGDACGHGAASDRLKRSVRCLVRRRSALPGSIDEIVTDVNRRLVPQARESCDFMTLLYAEFDLSLRRMRWISAGHGPPMLYHPKEGLWREPGLDRYPPLGIPAGSGYSARRGELVPGQVVAIGTDGIWEARNPAGEMFGKARLGRILRERAAEDADAILSAAFDALVEFTGTAGPEDDAVLVIVKVR